MCTYQHLFHDDKTGYVIRCAACGHFQVCFGNVLVTFGEAAFRDFCFWISRWREEQYPAEDMDVKAVVIPTPCEGMRLLLSVRELDQLHIMLEAADTEWRSQEMLKLFTIPS
ncbi:MAG: hypothetical protein QM731_22930 [Chitinophagaceae bacterium]